MEEKKSNSDLVVVSDDQLKESSEKILERNKTIYEKLSKDEN